MEKNTKTYLIVGGMVLGLGLTYFAATTLVPKAFVTFTKAAPATVISLKDSYVLGERLLAKADGKDACIVNVFVMDASGKGVKGKEVSMEGMEGIVPTSTMTDAGGKASFKMTSEKEGMFSLTAMVEGTPLSRIVKVTFRN